MSKEFQFKVNEHQIKILCGFLLIKLYIDGECRDTDNALSSNGKTAILSANLGELGILEIIPKSSGLFSIEIDAYLVGPSEKRHVFSSHKRLSLKEQRMAK